MYKIGELSALCRIPVKTLRFYDSEGILAPVYIDNFTGYRYYSASQLSDCYKIVKLKELGFTLAEIRSFISADPGKMQELPADDGKVIGTWEVCGLWRDPEEFVPDKPNFFPPESWYWRKAVFSEGGSLTNTFGTLASGKTDEVGAPTWRWVNGYTINTKTSTASSYLFREIDGMTYLFIQWKSGDYLYGGDIPFWYVFKRVNK